MDFARASFIIIAEYFWIGVGEKMFPDWPLEIWTAGAIISSIIAIYLWRQELLEIFQSLYPQKPKKKSLRLGLARIAALANRIERNQATMEEEYHAYLTSPFYRAWFQEHDLGNYKKIAQRARSAGVTFLF